MRKFFRALRRIWRIERPDCQVSIQVRQPLVFAAFGVALVWYLAAPSPTTVMATVALGGMILSGFVWVRLLGARLRAERRLRYIALQVGDQLEEEVCVENPARLPALWAEFEDHSNIPGHTLSSVRGVDARGEARWRVKTLCARRGVFALGPWSVVTGDPFGIFSLRLTQPSREEVLIYPPLAPLPPDVLPKGRALGDQRMLRQALPAETINIFTTRPYVPGDPLHHIHWRSTARRQSLFSERAPAVKVFEPESHAAVWLIPDLDAAAQWGQDEQGSLEKLIILAASLASDLLAQRRAVGLFALGAHGQVVIPPQAGMGHIWALLRGLAGLYALAQPFQVTLAQAARVISPRSLRIALTPSLQCDWADALSSGFGYLSSLAGGQTSDAAAILLRGEDAPQGWQNCEEILARRGIPARAIRAADIQPPASASYGALRSWEFTTLGTGRAYARRKPRQAQEQRP